MNARRLSPQVFLGMLGATLILTSLLVAFVVNVVDFGFMAGMAEDFPLPWDPTHTALKYLMLGVLLGVAGVTWRYWWPRVSGNRKVRDLELVRALMLVIAVPIGAAGYECAANHWGVIRGLWAGPEQEELLQDPYVYLANPGAQQVTLALRVRSDIAGLGRWLLAVTRTPDSDGLQARYESKVSNRRLLGIGLMAVAAGLVVMAWRRREEPAPTEP